MGRELAFRYAKRGCKLVISARNIDELEKVWLS
jgi:short-subunit dehydrogenase